MADVRRIIEKIMADPKIATNSNLASKVYRDEPLLFTAPQMENFTPPKIREMRKLAKAGDSEAKIFCEQGTFMKDFEDDFNFKGEFVHYFPTYQALTDVQLRGYFSWRTKVRKGVIGKTSLSFVFMYIYELLNQIGVESPEDGFCVLKNFWMEYKEIDGRISSYVTLWLKDYVVYNNLDKAFLDGLPDAAFDAALGVLLDYGNRSDGEVFAALNSLSAYDLEKSKFFMQYPDDVKKVVCRVFSVVSTYYNRNPKNSAREKLFGRMCLGSYSMFKAAVFHHRAARGIRVYEIGGFHRYICENGVWSCERFVGYGLNNKRIGALLKTVDYFMRQSRGYKSSLQIGKTNKVLTGKIEKEIAKYEKERAENAPRVIDIDISKLHGIRAAASATRDRLLVGDEESEELSVVEEKGGERESVAGLSEVETGVVRCLLYGGDYDGIVRARGALLSVVVDGINGKLFDLLGDTAIVDGGSGPEVLEEYRKELKGIIPR